MNNLPTKLSWSTERPKKDAGPLLFNINGEFELLTWAEGRQAFCVGYGGWGDDRYTYEELAGHPWAALRAQSE